QRVVARDGVVQLTLDGVGVGEDGGLHVAVLELLLELGERELLCAGTAPQHVADQQERNQREHDIDRGATEELLHEAVQGTPPPPPSRLAREISSRTRRRTGGCGTARPHRGRSRPRTRGGCGSPRTAGQGRCAGGPPAPTGRTPRGWPGPGPAGCGADTT